MLTTLFHIPARIGIGGLSLPLLGWGLLLALWAVIGLVALAWTGWRQGLAAAVRSLAPPLAISGGIILWGLPALDDGQGVPIRGYGVMLLAAAAAGTWLSIVRGRAVGIDADTIVALGLEVFLAGIVGARLFYVIEYHEQGYRSAADLEPERMAALVKLEEADRNAYWMSFNNFYVITRYNRSPMYAMVVYELSEALREGMGPA